MVAMLPFLREVAGSSARVRLSDTVRFLSFYMRRIPGCRQPRCL
jgi:hypothetical protein